jgi:hypothetical protein
MVEEMMTIGSRAQVFHGTAKKTSGGLTKKDLKKNKYGSIVSAKKSKTMKKEGLKRFGDKLAPKFTGKKPKTRKTRKTRK